MNKQWILTCRTTQQNADSRLLLYQDGELFVLYDFINHFSSTPIGFNYYTLRVSLLGGEYDLYRRDRGGPGVKRFIARINLNEDLDITDIFV